MGRTKWCKVRVLKNGREDWPYKYAKVSGEVSGFWGGFTPEVETDERGIAKIEWELGDHLDKIYVGGGLFQASKEFKGPFEEGETYEITYKV